MAACSDEVIGNLTTALKERYLGRHLARWTFFLIVGGRMVLRTPMFISSCQDKLPSPPLSCMSVSMKPALNPTHVRHHQINHHTLSNRFHRLHFILTNIIVITYCRSAISFACPPWSTRAKHDEVRPLSPFLSPCSFPTHPFSPETSLHFLSPLLFSSSEWLVLLPGRFLILFHFLCVHFSYYSNF